MVPSIPAALERVVGKALNKVPEERYETARQMQLALFSIRAGLSGATDTTERRSEEHTSELQSQSNLVCRLLLEKKKKHISRALTSFTLSHSIPPSPLSSCRTFHSANVSRYVYPLQLHLIRAPASPCLPYAPLPF